MEEKRRSERIPVHITLSISDIYRQDRAGIHNLDSPIEVVDISGYGIGFDSECILPLNYYFKAELALTPDLPVVHTIVKIIRIDVLDRDMYRYGCEFTDLSAMDRSAIESITMV